MVYDKWPSTGTIGEPLDDNIDTITEPLVQGFFPRTLDLSDLLSKETILLHAAKITFAKYFGSTENVMNLALAH